MSWYKANEMDDCRHFALAYAIALCSEQNPECLLFKHSVMRAHLLKCLEEEDTKPFPCKTVNRTQQKNKTGKIEIFCKCRTQEGGSYLALDVGNGIIKNACPYQNKFGEKKKSVSGIVTAVERNTVCVIVYIFFLIHMCVHLDMLNINEVIVQSQ